MLTFTRYPRERVVITASNGERIEIEVGDLFGGKARLRFYAPPAVTINRAEVQAEIDRGAPQKRQQIVAGPTN